MLGVDPGMAATGLAAVSRTPGGARLASALTVRTPAGAPEGERLREIHRRVADMIDQQRPEAVAVERLMWGRNVGSAMSVARATGVILLAAADREIDVHEYAPLEVKMAVTGNGGASKADVRRALSRLHGVEPIPGEPDAAAAAAVAICHLQQVRSLRGAAT